MALYLCSSSLQSKAMTYISDMNRICLNCGLRFGSHRADNVVKNQCPQHEGKMDWPNTNITIFEDSGESREVDYGTSSKIFRKRMTKKKTPLELMRQIRAEWGDDGEEAHSEADALLCSLVRKYVPNGREVIKEYEGIRKRYS